MRTWIRVTSLLLGLMVTNTSYASGEPDALRGGHYYRSYCAVCHGVDGKGNGALAKKLDLAPANLSAPEIQTKKAHDLVAIIGGYVKENGAKMPSWGDVLTDQDLQDIAAYVPKLALKDSPFVRDTRRGRAIFKTFCIACHGQFGNGNGKLAGLIDIPMVDYTKSETLQNVNDAELIGIIREGKGDYMPAWQEALDDKEMADVASYVRRLSLMTGTSKVPAQYQPNPLAGKNLYRTYCVVCHGNDGKSKGPLAEKLKLEPADLSGAQYKSMASEDLTRRIAGYANEEKLGMPRWGKVLPEPDLYDIAAYIRKIGHGSLRFRGDIRRGRVVFKQACAACHGQNGTGRGVLAKLIKILMLDFTQSEDMAEMSDDEIVLIIREGKGDFMPSWRGILSDDDIIDVASYVSRLAK